ncbi:nucleoside triphosphate pyrophosphohydrolase [Thalassovita gelatinovora]|uniref:8-oxo-dGTP diphosphatase n=1 Tax=Thalassovita gelatinovora TaxID=53501 RepID=A0A0P1FAL4_THAGE|nr:NUDIX hydrolase [Thalassovita gelatinovora]QIZ80615.1 NUDIX domain-containing protein [Thalassovita gelatinovora]CUH65156.1 nucleoside triphosphate pyrophosphohydrolase [Thalassovita gelatinovora]SER19841.1 8-oxo-dGTP diphosphatase [Thalassovita gelatinovora]
MGIQSNVTAFAGAKLMLFVGEQLAVILRDDFSHIPWPDYWDFPGGERDPGETPEQCVIRETEEELSIRLVPGDLVWKQIFPRDDQLPVWFYAAHLPAARMDDIKLGDEGQRWQMMQAETYLAHPKAIPHFAERLRIYLRDREG